MNIDEQEQRAMVAEFKVSGMKAKAWCEAKDIKYQRYVTWASRLNREGQHELQQWADVTIAKEEHATSEIRLNCGKWTIFVATGFNPSLHADILKVVDSVC